MSAFDVDPELAAGGAWIVAAGQGNATPALFAESPQSARRFWEFFTAEIPNDNTRKAYFCAILRFDAWCVFRNLALLRLQPILIAAYIKDLQASLSIPSVKQHLAASRVLWVLIDRPYAEYRIIPSGSGGATLGRGLGIAATRHN